MKENEYELSSSSLFFLIAFFLYFACRFRSLASSWGRISMKRLHLYDVIMRYALYGEEPTDLNGEQMRTFILIRSSGGFELTVCLSMYPLSYSFSFMLELSFRSDLFKTASKVQKEGNQKE